MSLEALAGTAGSAADLSVADPTSGPGGLDLIALVTATRAVVEEAVALVRAMLERPVDNWAKADRSPVTDVDLAVDRFLRPRLEALFPAAWLSEETIDEPGRLQVDRVWVVDPIDGTRSLIEGSGQFCISVALVECGLPVLGVVANPSSGERFYGCRGAGAFDGAGQRLQVSQPAPGARLRLLVSATELRRGLWHDIGGEFEIAARSSLAYKLALVASGDVDATLTPWPRSEWDAAAGHLLVELAGGDACDIGGQPLRYNRPAPIFDGIAAGGRATMARVADLRRELLRRREKRRGT